MIRLGELPVWRCEGFRPVRAVTADAAAAIFANRLAVKSFGRKGYMRTLRLDAWTTDRRDFTFAAFIGYSVGNGTTAGCDVWLFIHRVGAPQEAHEQRPPD